MQAQEYMVRATDWLTFCHCVAVLLDIAIMLLFEQSRPAVPTTNSITCFILASCIYTLELSW